MRKYLAYCLRHITEVSIKYFIRKLYIKRFCYWFNCLIIIIYVQLFKIHSWIEASPTRLHSTLFCATFVHLTPHTFFSNFVYPTTLRPSFHPLTFSRVAFKHFVHFSTWPVHCHFITLSPLYLLPLLYFSPTWSVMSSIQRSIPLWYMYEYMCIWIVHIFSFKFNFKLWWNLTADIWSDEIIIFIWQK